MENQLNIFAETAQQFWGQIAMSLPQILAAIILFVVGWIIARLVKKMVIKLLTLAKFNYVTEKTGIDKFLKDGGLSITTIDILGTLVYWVIMLIVIMATLNSLQLTTAALLFNEIMLYVPNLIVAIIILILGIYLGRLVAKSLHASLLNANDVNAALIGRIAFYSIIVLTVFIILSQLQIAEPIVTSAFQIFFGAICLALALAFGLGGKDWAAGKIKKHLD